MAEAKKDNSAKQPNEGNAFKTAALGYDKNDVNVYIYQLRKDAMKNEDIYKAKIKELEDMLSKPRENESEASGEQSDKLKKDYEDKLMDQRKLVLDERRKAAQLDKENAKTQMEMKARIDEIEKLKELVTKKNDQLKKIASTPLTAQNSGISGSIPVAKANEIIEDAQKKAAEIIENAKTYASTVNSDAQKYKAECEAAAATLTSLNQQVLHNVATASAPLDGINDICAQAVAKTVSEANAQISQNVNTASASLDGLNDVCAKAAEATLSDVNEQIAKNVNNASVSLDGLNDICTKAAASTVNGINEQITKNVNAASASLDGLSDVFAKVAEAQASVAAVKTQLETLIAGISEIVPATDVSSEVENAKANLAAIIGEMSATTPEISVSADVDTAKANLAAIVDGMSSTAPELSVSADVDAAKANLAAIVDGMSAESPAIDVTADVETVKANFAAIIAQAESIAVPTFEMSEFSADSLNNYAPMKVEAYTESESDNGTSDTSSAFAIEIDVSGFDTELEEITSGDTDVLASMELETLESLSDVSDDEPDDSFFVVDTEKPAETVKQSMGNKKHTEPEPEKPAENIKINGLEDLFVDTSAAPAPMPKKKKSTKSSESFDDMIISSDTPEPVAAPTIESVDDLFVSVPDVAQAEDNTESATSDFDNLIMSMDEDDSDEMSEDNVTMPAAPTADTIPVPHKPKAMAISEIKPEEKGEDLGEEMFEIKIDSENQTSEDPFAALVTPATNEDDDDISSVFVPLSSSDITMGEVSIADAPPVVHTDVFGNTIPMGTINATKDDELAESFKTTTPPPMQQVDEASNLWDFGDADEEEEDDMSSDNVGVSDLLI